MIDFTLDDLARFTRKEKEMFNEILPETNELQVGPGEEAIRNILNYSRSLSVRNSNKLGKLKLLLN